MDMWKLVLIAAAVLGLVVILHVASGPGELPPPPEGRPIEEGTYALEENGKTIGEERFAVWLVEGGFRVDSALRLEWQNLELTAWLRLGADWAARQYEARLKRARGGERLSARIEDGEATVETKAGLTRRAKKLPGVPPMVVLESSAIGPWYAVYRFFQGVRGRRATALLPWAGSVAPLQAGPPEPVELRVRGRNLPAERFRVQVGDEEILLYGQGDLLLGVAFPGRRFVAYLVEVLPDGLVVVATPNSR